MSLELQIALISSSSAVLGSLVGGWIGYLSSKKLQKQQWQQQQTERLAVAREQLYSEFLAEVGRHFLVSLESKAFKTTEFTVFFALLSRVRLSATEPVVCEAEKLGSKMTKLYLNKPAKGEEVEEGHFGEKFSEACRIELDKLRKSSF